MSILHRPMFSKEPPEFPANEAAVRCARIRVAGVLEWMPWVVVAPLLGVLFSGVEMVVVLPLAMRMYRRSVFEWNLSLPSLWSATVISAFTAIVFVGAPRVVRWMFDREAGAGRMERRRRRRQRLSRFWMSVLWLSPLLAIGLGASSGWQTACLVTAMAANVCGMSLLVIGLRIRTGARLVCAWCGYPMGSWRMSRNMEKCPECGRAWREAWGQRFGVRRVSRSARIGAGMLLASMVMVVVAARGM